MSSDSDSATSQDTSQQDNRRVIGEGGLSIEAERNSTVNVTSLDRQVADAAIAGTVTTAVAALNSGQASIGQAFDFGQLSLTKAFDFGLKSIEQNRTATQAALTSIADSSTLVKDAYADAKGRGALTDKILIGAVAMAGVVAVAALRK